ncbi:MAG TPA: hypothetical protein DIT64_21410 [Verrucomicrobiales bacterium]|nr:hypothetical protein [Verrucomicrobiales bacterium]
MEILRKWQRFRRGIVCANLRPTMKAPQPRNHMLELRRAFCLPLLLTLATIHSGEAAGPLRFEDGNSVQLIDIRGELIEWPRSRESFWTGPGLSTLTSFFARNYVSYSSFDALSPEPLGVAPAWPVQRPATVNAWIRASDHLAQSDAGMLFEIRTAGLAFGRVEVHRIEPAPIPFPPNVFAWTDFASSSRLRLAIGASGELWCWESPITNHPRILAGSSPASWEAIAGTLGTNVVEIFEVAGNLSMHRVAAPAEQVSVIRVKFPRWYEFSSPGTSVSLPYVDPFVALGSDGELYQFGVYRQFVPDYYSPGQHLIAFVQTQSPVRLERPVSVSGWSDFSMAGRQLCAVSEDGDLYVWGHNDFGQVGNGSLEAPPHLVLVTKPPGVTRWKRVEPTAFATFARGDDGKLYGWGELSPYRSAVPGEPDVLIERSSLSHIKLRPTPLTLGSPADRVVDFALNAETLVVLLASGKTINYFDYHRGSLPYMDKISSSEQELPEEFVRPVINRRPHARFLNPVLLSQWDRTRFTLIAEALDLDGSVSSVVVLDNGRELGAMTLDQGLFTFEWNQIARGRHELVVRATDDQGAMAESVPVVLYIERDYPSILEPGLSESGSFAFKVARNEWAPIRVEWSSDLKQWHLLQSINTGSIGKHPEVVDPATGMRRFYRVVVDEPTAEP